MDGSVDALRFDGANDWVTVVDAADLDLGTGMTLEAWVYPTALSEDRWLALGDSEGDGQAIWPMPSMPMRT